MKTEYPNSIGLRQALEDWLEEGRPTDPKDKLWNQLTLLISVYALAAVRRAMATHNDRNNNAEDVAQEVMLRVIGHLRNPEEQFFPRTFQAYIATAAKNALIDKYRYAKRHKITLLGSGDEEGDPLSFIVDEGQLHQGEARLLFDECFERRGEEVWLNEKIRAMIQKVLPELGPAQKQMSEAMFFGDIQVSADLSSLKIAESRKRYLQSNLAGIIVSKLPDHIEKDRREEIGAALKLCIENRWPEKDPKGRIV